MEKAEGGGKTHIALVAIALFVVVGGVALGLMATSGRQPDSTVARGAGDAAVTDTEPVIADPGGAPRDEAASLPDGESAEASGAAGSAEPDAISHDDIDASGQISEERYINISVRIMMAAIGFQNAGQGHAELEAYMPELLAKEGVTAEALQRATDELMKDPEQAERVSDEVVKRVEKITGVQMDMSLIQQLDPNWKPEAR